MGHVLTIAVHLSAIQNALCINTTTWQEIKSSWQVCYGVIDGVDVFVGVVGLSQIVCSRSLHLFRGDFEKFEVTKWSAHYDDVQHIWAFDLISS